MNVTKACVQHKWRCQDGISFISWRSVNRITTLQTKPCYFSPTDRFNFKHMLSYIQTLKDMYYIHIGSDKGNIQIKYCAKVQLLFRLVILVSQFHTGKDYKCAAKKDKIIFLNPLGYCWINLAGRKGRKGHKDDFFNVTVYRLFQKQACCEFKAS